MEGAVVRRRRSRAQSPELFGSGRRMGADTVGRGTVYRQGFPHGVRPLAHLPLVRRAGPWRVADHVARAGGMAGGKTQTSGAGGALPELRLRPPRHAGAVPGMRKIAWAAFCGRSSFLVN